MNEKERNLRIAQSVYRDFSWNGQDFREGDYLALLDGSVVAVARSADDAITALRSFDPNPKRGMVIVVTHPVVDAIREVR